MRRQVLLLMLLGVCATQSLAQKDTTWLRRWAGSGTTYQEDWARDIAVDDLGNIYVTGICNAGGTGGSYVTLKYSPGGKLRWERFYSGAEYNEAHALAVDPSYNVWVTGESGGSATRDVYTTAYGPEGNVVWQGRFDFGGTDVGEAIDAFEAGHAAVTGYASKGGAPVLFHGSIGWSRQVPGMWGQAIDVVDSSVTVAGADGGMFGVIRYDLLGNLLWHSKSGSAVGGYSLAVASLVVDSSGNSYVTGTTGDLYTVSFGTNGNVRWSATYSGPRRDEGIGIALDSKHNVISAGSTDQSTGSYYAYHGLVMKHDSLGNALWSKVLDFGGVNEHLYTMAIGRGDTIYVAGDRYLSQSGDADYLVAKLSPDGDVVWWTTYAGNGSSYSTASAMATDTSSGLYVTGWSSQNNEWPDNADIVTMKFWGKEPFLPDPDGWQFANTEEDMWPQTWWSQFHYNLPPYPLNFTQWPINAKSSDFPDWPLFVEAFGEDQCYFPSTAPGSYIWKPSAILSWRNIVRQWRGSCFGFSTSSLLIFNDYLSFDEMFPGYYSVFQVPLSDKWRRLVNKYHLYQDAKTLTARYAPLYAKTPIETARELITMISDNARNNQSLSIFNNHGSGAHEIVPCKVGEEGFGLIKVTIYDSNRPGTEEVLWIDTVMNTWSYDNLPGWGGSQRIFLGLDISAYGSKPGLPKAGPVAARAQRALGPDSAGIILYVTEGAGCRVTDGNGGALGYNPSDSSLTTTMSGAFPIIPRTGGFSPPIGYYLPVNQYDIQASSSPDTSFYIRAIGDGMISAYEEHGAQQGEKTHLRVSGAGDTLAVRNLETRPRTGMLRSIRVSPDREMACEISDITLPGNDSLVIASVAGNSVRLDAGTSPSTYTLSLTLAAPSTSLLFRHRGVALSAQSTHIVAPDWDRLDSAPVTVVVDTDRDGTPDDTLALANEITDVSHPPEGTDVPGSFRLDQNYPNPFNATTTIRYGLPLESVVRLTVYNILGQEVATLVHEVKEAGYHDVKFDASSLSSGVYLYRLQAGRFVQTRRLILLK